MPAPRSQRVIWARLTPSMSARRAAERKSALSASTLRAVVSGTHPSVTQRPPLRNSICCVLLAAPELHRRLPAALRAEAADELPRPRRRVLLRVAALDGIANPFGAHGHR